MKNHQPYLQLLEAEAIYIMREIHELCDKPAMLFSGGKDSIVMAHLAKKAFWPSFVPFPIVHIDTGHNFKETITFRDQFAKQHNLQLIIGHVEDSIKKGSAQDPVGPYKSRNSIQSITLLETIEHHQFDALFGGARRDEEKARAKERLISHRNAFGEWSPKNQRPEIGMLFNTLLHPQEHFRVFPLSNWTELDVWNYIKQEEIELPSLYFSHKRQVFERQGHLYPYGDMIELLPSERVEEKTVRFRTIGDITCTGALSSNAQTIDDIIAEILSLKTSERGTRLDDKVNKNAMENRKKQGYF